MPNSYGNSPLGRGFGGVRAEASAGLNDLGPGAPRAAAVPAESGFMGGQDAGNPLEIVRFGEATAFEKRLPEAAAARYVEIQERKADAQALYRAPTGDINRLRTEIHAHERHIEELTRHNGIKEDHPSVVDVKNKVAAHQAKLGRLFERQNEHARHQQAIAAVIQRLDRYLGDGALSRLKPVAAPKIAKADTIDAVAGRIAELRQQLEEVAAAPWPAADAKARAAREIAALAAQGRIGVVKSVLHRNQLEWPVRQRDFVLRGFGHVDARGMPDMFNETALPFPVAIMAWLHQDEIVAKLHAEIDAVADEAAALSAEERGGRVARITASILAEERVLAEIVWRDKAHDLWPADIDPRAALGVDGPAPRQD